MVRNLWSTGSVERVPGELHAELDAERPDARARRRLPRNIGRRRRGRCVILPMPPTTKAWLPRPQPGERSATMMPTAPSKARAIRQLIAREWRRADRTRSRSAAAARSCHAASVSARCSCPTDTATTPTPRCRRLNSTTSIERRLVAGAVFVVLALRARDFLAEQIRERMIGEVQRLGVHANRS